MGSRLGRSSASGVDAGHARDHLGVFVLAKPALDELVDLGDLSLRRITSLARVYTSWAVGFSDARLTAVPGM